MNIYLIRHGVTPLNKQKKVNGEINESLTPEGIDQAKAIIPFIPKNIQYIYSSSLLRAKQTAQIIAQNLDIPLSLHDELSEIHMGSLAGKSWEEMPNGLELKQNHRTVKFNYEKYGGESVKQVKKRLLLFFKKINNKYNDDEVLIVTHGGIIRLLYLLENGESVYETEKHVSLLKFDLDKILNASI